MFTGLVEAVGTIESTGWEADGSTLRLWIAASPPLELKLGDSIAVDGVCLTAVEVESERFAVQCSPTTLALTTLGQMAVGTPVNLERSVTPSTRLGGHIVLGHVDAVGTVEALKAMGLATELYLAHPPEFSRWVVDKGSVAVNGVSLTVVDKQPGRLHITVIPHTAQATNLGRLGAGSRVNLEFDVLAKYVAELLGPYLPQAPASSET